jgi:hypothetical protein
MYYLNGKNGLALPNANGTAGREIFVRCVDNIREYGNDPWAIWRIIKK